MQKKNEKIKKGMKAAIIILAFLSLLFSSCYDLFNDGETTLIINLGGGSGARSAWPHEENPAILGELVFEITLTGNGEIKTLTTNGNDIIRTTVSAGRWKVDINAYYQNELYGIGSETVDVKAGQANSVFVDMYKAFSDDPDPTCSCCESANCECGEDCPDCECNEPESCGCDDDCDDPDCDCGCGDTVSLVFIKAIYKKTDEVYPDTPLDNLKDNLTVTAHYSDGTDKILDYDDYELSGELEVGTSTITVTYKEETATFYVDVSPAPEYGIALSVGSTHTFTPQNYGYGPQTPLTVTVTNIGNQPIDNLNIALSDTNADSFTLSTTSITEIAVGGSETFTVVPKDGLAAGNYTATVTVTGDNNISKSFNVSFTVSKATGAEVSGAPTMASKTTTSITLKAVTLTNNPGGQAVEYACHILSTAPDNDWVEANESTVTFDDLNLGTTYYFFARAKENTNYNAGSPSNGTAIATLGESTITINLWENEDENILENSVSGYISKSANQTYTVNVTGGFEVYSWILQGTLQTSNTSPITINAAYLDVRDYILSIIVKKNDVPYSTQVTITVTD